MKQTRRMVAHALWSAPAVAAVTAASAQATGSPAVCQYIISPPATTTISIVAAPQNEPVLVTDLAGNPVSGILVTGSLSGTGYFAPAGSPNPQQILTDSNGVATFRVDMYSGPAGRQMTITYTLPSAPECAAVQHTMVGV